MNGRTRGAFGRMLLELDQSLINRLFRVVKRAAELFVETVGDQLGLSINDWRVLARHCLRLRLSQQAAAPNTASCVAPGKLMPMSPFCAVPW